MGGGGGAEREREGERERDAFPGHKHHTGKTTLTQTHWLTVTDIKFAADSLCDTHIHLRTRCTQTTTSSAGQR